jgi:hypothetical protein
VRGACERLGTEASEGLTRTLGRSASDDRIRAWAPHAVGRLLGGEAVPDVPPAEEDQLFLDAFAAILRGAADRLRPLHGTRRGCWPRVTAGRIEIVVPDGDPCGGACASYVERAIRDLTVRYGEEDRSPARCRSVAASKVTDAERSEHAAVGMYVRLDRLDPDEPGNFEPHPDRSHRPLRAPAWYRNAIPDALGRRRAYELLRHARNNDPVVGTIPWPLERWMDDDGLSRDEELALVERILDALTTSNEAWVERNVWRPLAAKPQQPSMRTVEELSGEGDASTAPEGPEGRGAGGGSRFPGPADRDEDIVALLQDVRARRATGLPAREAVAHAVEAVGGTVRDLDELVTLVGEVIVDAYWAF